MKSLWLKKEDQLTRTPADIEQREGQLKRDLLRMKCGVRGHYFYTSSLKCPCGHKMTVITNG